MHVLIKIGIIALIVGGVFAFLWWQGYVKRLADYVSTTREELRKCTWPTIEELKGSTTVISISILLLGGFTVAADFLLGSLLHQILSLTT